MWFAQALLIFTVVLTAGVAVIRRFSQPARSRGVSYPTNSSLAVTALLTGAAAWLLRLKWPVGVNVWGLQFGYFASYVVLRFHSACDPAAMAYIESSPRWAK